MHSCRPAFYRSGDILVKIVVENVVYTINVMYFIFNLFFSVHVKNIEMRIVVAASRDI